jgi:alkylhydroperoxidase family enzyme
MAVAVAAVVLAAWAGLLSARAADPAGPPPDRRAMLAALEALKERVPRLPMPTEAVAAIQAGATEPVVNNALMRRLHLPAAVQGPTLRQKDPALGLPDDLAVELFWIASRANDCHYCLGHQEGKLANLGVGEETRADLDADWSAFPPDRQAAFALARQLTLAPHTVGAAEVDALRSHFPPERILEIVFLVARYNSTNRWTLATGIPQESFRSFASELPPPRLSRPTIVATGPVARPEPLPAPQWHARMAALAGRRCRLPLADSGEPLDRLLRVFPVAGSGMLEQWHALDSAGRLPPRTRAALVWTAARADGAWFMQHEAHRRLQTLGLDDAEIFALDTAACPPDLVGPVRFARRLTALPQQVGDDDIARLLAEHPPELVAEMIFTVGLTGFLDRLTEAAGLGWETTD